MPDAVITLADEDLGNASYLLDLGDGRALVVDPPLDLRALRGAAAERGLRIAYAAETHLHADFLSGAHQLGHDDVTVLASRAGGRLFPHRGLEDDEEVDLGGLTLRALATPGHTGEHLALLVLDGTREVGVFTGGSLLAGSAARVDLSGPEHVDELAAAQLRSLRRLAQLPDSVAVWPTHGGGSFCSTGAEAGSTSTIGEERASNPLLAAPDLPSFRALLDPTMGSFPPYFLRLPEINRRGPELLDPDTSPEQWSPDRVAAHLADGGQVVDVRAIEAYAAGHLPGSVSDAWRPGFTAWLGWVADPAGPLVLVRDETTDPRDLVARARMVGLDGTLAELAGGLPAWRAAGHPTRTVPLVDPGDAAQSDVLLDVRQDREVADTHVAGARHVELGDLVAAGPEDADEAAGLAGSDRRVLVMCGHGERAMTAASLLESAGRTGVSVLAGGPEDVVAAG